MARLPNLYERLERLTDLLKRIEEENEENEENRQTAEDIARLISIIRLYESKCDSVLGMIESRAIDEGYNWRFQAIHNARMAMEDILGTLMKVGSNIFDHSRRIHYKVDDSDIRAMQKMFVSRTGEIREQIELNESDLESDRFIHLSLMSDKNLIHMGLLGDGHVAKLAERGREILGRGKSRFTRAIRRSVVLLGGKMVALGGGILVTLSTDFAVRIIGGSTLLSSLMP